MRRIKIIWIAATVVLAWTGLAGAAVITDTVADFSGTQGLNGYQYGYVIAPYYDPATTNPNSDPLNTGTVNLFAASDYSVANSNWAGHISQGGGTACCLPEVEAERTHGISNPNADNPSDPGALPTSNEIAAPFRQWTSNYAGLVTISGDYRADNFCCGSSQTIFVYVNGVEKVSGLVGPAAGESSSSQDPGNGLNWGPDHTYSFNVTLSPGDKVTWLESPDLGFYGDLTILTGTIQAAPEPNSMALFGLVTTGLALCGRLRRSA